MGISNGHFCEALPNESALILYDTLAKDCWNEMTGGLKECFYFLSNFETSFRTEFVGA
jgi:hypothetical protein